MQAKLVGYGAHALSLYSQESVLGTLFCVAKFENEERPHNQLGKERKREGNSC